MAPTLSEPFLSGLDDTTLSDILAIIPYPARRHPDTDSVSAAANDWLLSLANYTPAQEHEFRGLKAGFLTGRCYVDCGREQLRAITDYIDLLFYLDDWSDESAASSTQNAADIVMNILYHPTTYSSDTTIGKITKSIWERMLTSIGSACQERFIQYMDMYLQAVYREADDRALGVTPKLEEYILSRRDTSGVKASFALLEYGCNIDLPFEVVNHPVIVELENATNDAVSWLNDIFSFHIEHSKGHTYNLVVVLMNSFSVESQTAIQLAIALVKSTIERFETNRVRVPSWGPEVDIMVEKYVQGLQDWIIGNTLWSFETHRYFGEAGAEVLKALRTEEVLQSTSVVRE